MWHDLRLPVFHNDHVARNSPVISIKWVSAIVQWLLHIAFFDLWKEILKSFRLNHLSWKLASLGYTLIILISVDLYSNKRTSGSQSWSLLMLYHMCIVRRFCGSQKIWYLDNYRYMNILVYTVSGKTMMKDCRLTSTRGIFCSIIPYIYMCIYLIHL